MINANVSGRWDLNDESQAAVPFDRGIAQVNLRRIELACLLEIATELLEYAMNLRFSALYVGLAGSLLIIPVARWARRWRRQHAQQALVIAVIIFSFAVKQWGVAELGPQGRVSTGYIFTLMTLTLIFIVPLRTMSLLMLVFFISYTLILLHLPVAPSEQVIAIVNAAIVSVIALIAGRLIFQSRRRDFEQKREIRLQNQQLVDRNEELDSLMAITAHDLRSPLFGLRNLFELTLRRSSGEPELPLTVLAQGIASLDAMLALVTRLLDAHAAEHQPLTVLVNEDLRGQILAAADRIGPLAQSAGVRLDIDLPSHPLLASFDAGALAQILDNLLSNAVRFSRSGGTINIIGRCESEHNLVRVCDEGPGVDPAQRHNLFKRFHRTEAGQHDSIPNMGMGLFIVATLATRMGAMVEIDAVATAGACFSVSLPKSGR